MKSEKKKINYTKRSKKNKGEKNINQRVTNFQLEG